MDSIFNSISVTLRHITLTISRHDMVTCFLDLFLLVYSIINIKTEKNLQHYCVDGLISFITFFISFRIIFFGNSSQNDFIVSSLVANVLTLILLHYVLNLTFGWKNTCREMNVQQKKLTFWPFRNVNTGYLLSQKVIVYAKIVCLHVIVWGFIGCN